MSESNPNQCLPGHRHIIFLSRLYGKHTTFMYMFLSKQSIESHDIDCCIAVVTVEMSYSVSSYSLIDP